MGGAEILGVAEARRRLPELLHRIRDGGRDPVFLGSHRRPEAVMLPLAVYEELQGRRTHAVDDAAGSLRAEGLAPSTIAAELAERYARGELTAAQLEAMLLAYHRTQA